MCAWQLRVRWWLAACACALAVRADSGWSTPFRCPDTEACAKEGQFLFYVDGRRYTLFHHNSAFVNMSCDRLTLDSENLPYRPILFPFRNVTLRNCPPPKTYASYTSALRARNIQASLSFQLVDIPANTNITAASLDRLPPILEIHAVDGILVVEPGAMAKLDGVSKVIISRVQFDQIESNLTYLEMRHSGYDRLPSGLLKNLQGEVKIVDDNVLEIIDTTLDLKVLKLETPALKKLTLRNVSVDLVPAGFLDGCSLLHRLNLSELRGDKLQRGFLRGAARLDTFALVENYFTTLPGDLFSLTPNLTKIDLSNNRLKLLSKELFSELKLLEHLWLGNNHLTASNLPDIESLTKLWDLQLSGNPLGDLCSPGGESPLSSLRKLEVLELASTNISHMCRDWLTEMTGLKLLQLRHNSIPSLSCSELPIIRNSIFLNSFIILKENQIQETKCSRKDYDLAASSPRPDQHVVIRVDSTLPCNCDTYWLLQVLRRRRISLHGLQYHIKNPEHANTICNETKLQCIPILSWERDILDDE